MIIHKHILHTAKLINDCPECSVTNELEISFTQLEKENRYYRKNEKKNIGTIFCNNCKSTIYPESWSENLEKVYEYHNKLAIPKSTQLTLQPISYAICLLVLTTIVALIYFLIKFR